MQVEPQAPRFTVELMPEGLRAVIPAGFSAFVFLFMIVWLGGWAIGEVSVIRSLLSPDRKEGAFFLVIWLAGWTVGGVFAVGTLLWQLAGRELVTIGVSSLDHRIEALGLGLTRSYRLSEISDLRATDYAAHPFRNQNAWAPPIMGASPGSIAFDYGARTVRLASALDQAEAKLLIAKLSPRLPRK